MGFQVEEWIETQASACVETAEQSAAQTQASFARLPLDQQVTLLNRMAIDLRRKAYEEAQQVATAVAKRYVAKYFWEDADDLAQSLLERFDRIWERYDPENEQGNPWGKYLYHRFSFEAKDYFRRLDPLGIGWPQKKEYPQWHRLGDEKFKTFQIEDSRNLDLPEPTEADFKNECEDLKKVLARQQEVNGFCWDVSSNGSVSKKPTRSRKRKDPIWDEAKRRVKFKRGSLTLQDYLLNRTKEHQLELGF